MNAPPRLAARVNAQIPQQLALLNRAIAVHRRAAVGSSHAQRPKVNIGGQVRQPQVLQQVYKPVGLDGLREGATRGQASESRIISFRGCIRRRAWRVWPRGPSSP